MTNTYTLMQSNLILNIFNMMMVMIYTTFKVSIFQATTLWCKKTGH